MCEHVHARVWLKYYAYIKAHDTGTPAGLSDDASLASHFCKNVFITNVPSRSEMLENMLFINQMPFKTNEKNDFLERIFQHYCAA